MRFGAFVPQGWRLDLVGIDPAQHWPVMTGVAHAIEALGFESLWVYDHFLPPYPPRTWTDEAQRQREERNAARLGGVVPERYTVPVATQEVTYEAWTLMGALAAVTERVRLGQMCTCNAYRPPSYLAKVAASIDVISGGRVEMGIGAGWYEHEFLAYGYEFPKASVRIGQLGEGVEIMRRMWTEEEVHFKGEHYVLEGAICRPKPVQDPHIPFWIAGGGEKLTLAVAARYASYTNFGDSLDEFRHKSQVLENHCADAGTDFGAITRSSNFSVVCESSERGVDDRIGWIVDKYTPFLGDERAERAARAFRSMAGTPDQLIDKLRPWTEAGLGYAICYFPDAAYDRSGLELFAAEVIPALR